MAPRQLSYVVAVAEESHFGRPAAKVRIAQPALSNRVLAPERELGVQFFIRTTRRVERKRAGAAFYERAVRILGEIDLSAEIVCSVADRVTKQIAIGTTYPAKIGVLPEFMSRIARKYPDIHTRIGNGTTDEIIRNIEAGRISLGSLNFFSIAYERYLLAVARDSPLSRKREINLEDLRNEKIVSFSRQNLSCSEQYFAQKFEQ